MHSRVGIMDLLHDHVSEKSTIAHVGITYVSICILMKKELENGEDRTMCPGCSLIIKVVDDKRPFYVWRNNPSPFHQQMIG